MAVFLSRITKCSGSRFKIQFQSWIWCILLKCLCLPCILSNCYKVGLTVYPQGDINIEYGKPLEIFCSTNGDNNYTSNDIHFSVGGVLQYSNAVNLTTRRLYIMKPEKQSKTYYCENNKSKQKCPNLVLVDSRPSDVIEFKCVSKNLQSINCSWTKPTSFSIVTYNLTFAINNNLVHPSCQAVEIEHSSTSYCVWYTDNPEYPLPRYRQQLEQQYFYMNATNVFGYNLQNFTIDHYSIVKPDPPEGLESLINGTHSVLLKWNIPENMYTLLDCGVEHIIEYQTAKVDNRTYFHTVDTSHLPTKNKTYKFNLKGLPFAHMYYEVRVYIKSKKAVERQFWSDYKYVLFLTASEMPNRPPDMVAGAFHQSTFNSHRIINVYWKQLEEWEEAGSNFTYKVLVSQNNKNYFTWPEKTKSMSFVTLNATFDALDVTVWSFNTNGSSVNSSHIYIPPENSRHSLKVTKFTKLAYGNGTYELSWVGIKNIDNFTLFWCQYNATQICIGRLDYVVLDSQRSSHIIDLPREFRYQFAISANNGSESSGMSWAKCDISKEGFIMYHFEVHFGNQPAGKSSVKLHWHLDCILQEGIITGYNISYCRTIKTSSVCDKTVGNKSVSITNPKQMNVTIDNLDSFKTYQFNFSLNTIYGQTNIENATVFITTLEDTPSRPRNVHISNVTYNSLVISWDPPQNKNGIIGIYEFWNYDKKLDEEKVAVTPESETSSNTTQRHFILTSLRPFTNYSLSIRACNTANLCSERRPNDNIFVRTSIGPPSQLKTPNVEDNLDVLKWEPPDIPGGTVDLYQIRRVKDESQTIITNTTDVTYTLTWCEGVVSSETYAVRAVNFDNDLYNGVLGDTNVTLPQRDLNEPNKEYYGPWSEQSYVNCRGKGSLTMVLIFIALLFLVGVVYGSIKLYKKYRKMEDIKPVLPNGLGIPEKDISKYTYNSWNPTNKDEKPSSDEMLLLPNSKTTLSVSDTKQKDDNCGTSDHTDSTALSSDLSNRGPIDRLVTTSDDGPNSVGQQAKDVEDNVNKEEEDEEDSSAIDTESSTEDSPYFSDEAFKKNPSSGYVQPVVNPTTGYVQSAPGPVNNSINKPTTMQPSTTSYVMAGLQPSVFTTSKAPLPVANPPQPSSGYVLAEDAQARSIMNLPKLGPSPPKLLTTDHLPTMPTVPSPAKQSADSSYIQLQSLDSLPSRKPSVLNSAPLKPPASSGYVSPADVVMNKHLNNMMTGQHVEESAILDPAMSPDAYCRFSWSTDPANDNLNSLLAQSPTRMANN